MLSHRPDSQIWFYEVYSGGCNQTKVDHRRNPKVKKLKKKKRRQIVENNGKKKKKTKEKNAGRK